MLRVVWSFLVSGLVATILLIARSSQLISIQHQEEAFDAPLDASETPFKLLLNHDEAAAVSSIEEPNVDLHNESLAVLGLTDWEIRSIVGNTDEASSIATCQPPSHVSKACCIGTYSRGGDINYKERYQCNATTLKDYHRLQQEAVVSSSSDCDVCRILQICLEYNLTVAFFGDSMTNQVVQGLICELQRRTYRVQQTRIPGKQDVCKKCIKWTLLLHISSPAWLPGQTVEMKFFFQYRYPFYYPEEELQVATSADVLILNLGLHWSWNGRMYETGRMHYRKSMSDFLGHIHQHGTQQLLVYRETSAQHFDADGGDWGLRTNASRKECVPIIQSLTTQATKWRESKVLKAAKKQGYRTMTMLWNNSESAESLLNDDATTPTLVVLPWWDFTARHHEMHPFQECSHYCSSPFLYLPLWRGLRLAMDRKQFRKHA